MVLSADVRELVRTVRARRADCVNSYAKGDSRLAEIVGVSRSSRALAGLYLVKVLEANPSLGKVRARRVMGELGIGPMATLSSIDDNVLARVNDAVNEAIANGGQP